VGVPRAVSFYGLLSGPPIDSPVNTGTFDVSRTSLAGSARSFRQHMVGSYVSRYVCVLRSPDFKSTDSESLSQTLPRNIFHDMFHDMFTLCWGMFHDMFVY